MHGENIMDKYVDKSLGGLKYTLTIMRGINRQVTEVIQYVNDEEITIGGDFILTSEKKPLF